MVCLSRVQFLLTGETQSQALHHKNLHFRQWCSLCSQSRQKVNYCMCFYTKCTLYFIHHIVISPYPLSCAFPVLYRLKHHVCMRKPRDLHPRAQKTFLHFSLLRLFCTQGCVSDRYRSSMYPSLLPHLTLAQPCTLANTSTFVPVSSVVTTS